jgi:RNA recognition motif-containing protein
MKIYVGNLSPETMENDLRKTFEIFGEVDQVNIATDKTGGQSRRYGFIEMRSKFHAHAAISELNGLELDGRRITVHRVNPQSTGQLSHF